MLSIPISAQINQLDARLESEVAEDALLTDIEHTLARLRTAYRVDHGAFDAATVAKLQHVRRLALGLRLFIQILDRWSDIRDQDSYQIVDDDLAGLIELFTGLPIRVRMQRQQEVLWATRRDDGSQPRRN